MPERLSPDRWFEQFGVTDGLIHQVLSEATQYGADDADIYFEHTTSTSVALSDRKVNRAYTGVDLGAGVRVVVGDQVGYAYTEDLSRASLIRAAQTAAQIARGGRITAPVNASPAAVPDFYPVSRAWSDVAMDVRVPMIRKWEEAAFAADSRIDRVQVYMGDTDKHILVVRADGRRVADYQPMTRGNVSCIAVDGDTKEGGSYNVAARHGLDFFDDARQDRLVNRAVERAIRALTAEPPPSGEMPVVLAAGSSGILLHEAIGHG
ncbi:MAG: TldD/PmbA family protein, partial [Myxococcota bacterium]